MVNFREIHSCDKSKGKPVLMENDGMYHICCGYCHEVVDYMPAVKK